MKMMLLTTISVLTTVVCWGLYGPILHWGQGAMEGSRMRPFICVGIAYCVIAVIAPFLFIQAAGENGAWTVTGTWWSLIAGGLGAIGALGIILAFHNGGNPYYVMPLVFAGAPVVSTLFKLMADNRWKELNPLFYAGLILVIVGAVTVQFTAPRGHKPKAVDETAPAAAAPPKSAPSAEDQA